jgi:hypothetical protein
VGGMELSSCRGGIFGGLSSVSEDGAVPDSAGHLNGGWACVRRKFLMIF